MRTWLHARNEDQTIAAKELIGIAVAMLPASARRDTVRLLAEHIDAQGRVGSLSLDARDQAFEKSFATATAAALNSEAES